MENKRDILSAAEAVILRNGYSAMTMDDVAREAQFSKATLYRYFRSKGEIVFEIIGNYLEEMKRNLVRIQRTRKSAREKLKETVFYVLQFIEKKENIARVFMLDRSFLKVLKIFVEDQRMITSRSDRELVEMIKTRRKEILGLGEDILAEGVKHGEFRKVDLPSAMTFLEAVIQGYSHGRFWDEKKRNVKQATDMILDLFIHGIENKKPKGGKGESR